MWSKNVEGAQNKTYNTMKNLTEEKHVDMMLEFVNLSTLDERMKGKAILRLSLRERLTAGAGQDLSQLTMTRTEACTMSYIQ